MQRPNGDTPWYLKDLIDKEEDRIVSNSEEDQIKNNKDFTGQPKSGTENIDHNDNGAIRFTPFSGDEDDLIKLLKNSPNHREQTDKHENDVFLFGSFLGGGLCCVLLLIYAFKDRIKSPITLGSASTEGEKCEQVTNAEVNPKSVTKITEVGEIKQTLATVKKEGNRTRELNGFFQGQPDRNQGENDGQRQQQEKTESLINIDGRTTGKRDLSGFFQNDVPALAEVISLSGLNKQESIKIVTKEIFETDRRNAEVSKPYFHFGF